ncbi:Dipicolinate synthase subunit A [compost metagenome]
MGNLKKDAYILDLASFPGGADKQYIDENNIKYDLALGLPGKVAPYASAKYIYEVIKQKLKI